MPTAKQIKDEIKRLEKIENGKLEVDTIKDLEFNLIRLRLAKAELKGFQAGEISKHKSDLQQELAKWQKQVNMTLAEIELAKKANTKNGEQSIIIMNRYLIQFRKEINLIEKELKEIKCQ
jgi:hypothetical protein